MEIPLSTRVHNVIQIQCLAASLTFRREWIRTVLHAYD